MKAFDLTGQRFGRLVALEVAARGKYRLWKCQCDCGETTIVASQSLRSGNTRSCGCLQLEANLKHGHAVDGVNSPTYRVWIGMNWRCRNQRAQHYAAYGGRGITICERWNAFENFLADMGEKPKGMSIDRIDNDGNYEPSNCRWATPQEQARNTRQTKLTEQAVAQIRALPKSVSSASIAQCFGVSHSVIHRARSGEIWQPADKS